MFGSETWTRLSTGATPDGEPYVVVRRDRTTAFQRATVWILVKRGTGKGPRWYNAGPLVVIDSDTRLIKFPEKKGVRLSDSRTDQILIALAEAE